MTSKQKIEVVNNVTGKRINSPLHLAVERNNDKIINYLLKQGAKIDLYNARGWNPF
jgi:ankyrin repeat protein